MATGPFLLRIEGVNLDSFVFDTQNLSTIRGGSLLLLDQIEGIGRTYPDLKPLSTGASVGLFRVRDGANAEALAATLRQELLSHGQLKHATFVVDVAQMQDCTSQSFVQAREQLIALNRFQQQHAPAVSVPEWNDLPDAKVCAIDKVRVADSGQNSASVSMRKHYGREAKQSFYLRNFPEETPNPADGMSFTNDLESLADGYANETLNRKVAVIYIDGNDFSRMQTKRVLAAASAEVEQRDIDFKLKAYRRSFLRNLLSELKRRPELWRNKNDEYRLEILLWGGDDMLLVVPAWMGWRTAALFYDTATSWTIGESPLKHATGIVFCHHRAPIHRITRLVKDLADLAKADRTRNLIAYTVLETFDHAGSNLGEYRSKRFPNVDSRKMLLDGEAISNAISDFEEVESYIPRSKVFLLIRLLLQHTHCLPKDDKTKKELAQKIKKVETEIRGSCQKKADTFNHLEGCLGGAPGSWAHLLELWDYLVN